MMIRFWILCICSVVVLPHCLVAHSFSRENKRLQRIEPLSHIIYEIAPRNGHFFEKRHQSASILEPRYIEHDDQLRLQLYAYNTTFNLHLEPNHDLIHPEAVIVTAGNSEKLMRHSVYKGHVVHSDLSDHRWLGEKIGIENLDSPLSSLGWARIMIRHDLMQSSNRPIIEGAFQYFGDLYHIKATTNYNLVKRANDPPHEDSDMIIYRESDTLAKRDDSTKQTCGFDKLNQPLKMNTGLLTKRFQSGCPTTKKINYMGAAADCTYVQYYKSKDAARIQIINNFNMASAIFEETFNIALGLINITIMDPTCSIQSKNKKSDLTPAWNRACNANYSLGNRLSDFSQWRATIKNDGAGLWHLMTNCPTGVEVGLAWLKQLCNTKSSIQLSSEGKPQYVSGAGVSAITREEWKVVAHEVGHGFGAIHDCNSDSCPCVGDQCDCCPLSTDTCDTGGSYLMTPISNASAENFSPCSVNTICSAFPSIGHCLSDPQDHVKSVYTLNTCGNGIKEEGEECDTGGEDTDCCDAKTCKLKKPAVCEDQNETCCHKCQIQPSTHMCRPAATPCDIAEFCTGVSAACPNDLYIKDGVTCGDGLTCASGQCTSRDEQCLSRGSVMNVTQSCKTNNEICKMSCNKPGSSTQCLQFSGNFIDGTPCGIGGYCKAGTCQNSDNPSSHWVKENLKIFIPVCVIAFLFVCGCLFLLFWFGCWRCTGYKEKRHIKNIGKNFSIQQQGPINHVTEVPGKRHGVTKVSPSSSHLGKGEVDTTANSSSSSLTVVEEDKAKKETNL